MKERQTRQLLAVYDVVSVARDHPSAEEVYRRVRRRFPRVSLGTVYRNLQKLAAQRRVRVVQLADRAACYDGMVEDHDHFLCERCGAVTDLVRREAAPPDCRTLARAGYVIGAHTLTIYGLCPKCGGQSVGRTGRAAERCRV